LREFYQRYQTELRRANALDFGDLILLTARLLENHPGVLADYQRRWKFVAGRRVPGHQPDLSTACCAC